MFYCIRDKGRCAPPCACALVCERAFGRVCALALALCVRCVCGCVGVPLSLSGAPVPLVGCGFWLASALAVASAACAASKRGTGAVRVRRSHIGASVAQRAAITRRGVRLNKSLTCGQTPGVL